MRRTLTFPLALAMAAIALAALGALGAPAQTQAQPPDESPCVPVFNKTVSPATVTLGDAVTIALYARAVCPTQAVTRHIVLVLDASGSMTGTPRAALIAGASRFVRDLDLPGNPGIRLGVVDFNDVARQLSPLTNDEGQVLDAIAQVGATGQTRIDLALLEALRVLRMGRGGANDILETLVLLTDGGNNAGCDAVRVAAAQVRGQGTLLLAIGLGADRDEACLRQVVGGPLDYFDAPSPAALEVVFQRVGDRILHVGLTRMIIKDTLPGYMQYVPESANPRQSAPDQPTDWLQWEPVWVPAEGLTFTFRAWPTSTGVLPTNLEAWGQLTDLYGRSRAWSFGVPSVEVIGDVATPATPGQSPCTVDAAMRAEPARVRVGEVVTVSHHVRVSCPHLPLSLVLVLDGSGFMLDQPHQRMVDAMQDLVRSLDLPGNPGTRIGVVEFNSAATTLAPLTNDRQAVLDAIARAGATDGSRIDRGILEAARLLRQGRQPGETDITEAVVVVSKGYADAGCGPVTMAAEQLRDQGILVMAVADCPNCDETCLEIAASPAYYFHLANMTAVREAVMRMQGRSPSVLARLVVSGLLSPDVTYVPGSASPTVSVDPFGGRAFAWSQLYVPLGDLTYTLQVRPTRGGTLATHEEASGQLTDWVDRVLAFRFAVPTIEVVDPNAPTATMTQTATPASTMSPDLPTPTPTAWSLCLPIAVRIRCVPRPVDLAVVLDTSPSMSEPVAAVARTKLEVGKQDALAVVRQLDLTKSRVAVIVAGSAAVTVHPLTGDLAEVERTIGGAALGNGSRLDLGLEAARAELLGAHRDAGRVPYILAVTDGRVDDPTFVIEAGDRVKVAGITLAVLAVGDDADVALLARVANAAQWVFRLPEEILLRLRGIACPPCTRGWTC
jgi:Mg-chelatase subunit ChlD